MFLSFAMRGSKCRDEHAEFGDTIFAKLFQLGRRDGRCTFHVMSVVSVAGKFSLIPPTFSSTRFRCCIVLLFALRFALEPLLLCGSGSGWSFGQYPSRMS
ncbi:hypothetical protein PMIN06_008020 [Paraphaeosphaeria minitans]